MAQRMEDTLQPPWNKQAAMDGARMQRDDKAGSYTLAEKYQLDLERFKRR
jgi:hypothetical protein